MITLGSGFAYLIFDAGYYVVWKLKGGRSEPRDDMGKQKARREKQNGQEEPKVTEGSSADMEVDSDASQTLRSRRTLKRQKE